MQNAKPARRPGRPKKQLNAAAPLSIPAPDPVNHPPHYTQGGIECLDAIKASMPHQQFIGYLKGNQLKYVWRYEHKGGIEDLKKAEFYLDRLMEELTA